MFHRLYDLANNYIINPLFALLGILRTVHGVERPATEQQVIDEKTSHLRLYHMERCPYCIKVRQEMMRLALHIELADIVTSPEARDELITGGGVNQVPCLRIEEGGSVRWMYESSDIVAWLRSQFPAD